MFFTARNSFFSDINIDFMRPEALNFRLFLLVGPLGIEPNLPAPKAGVLPVYYGPMGPACSGPDESEIYFVVRK